MKRIVQCPKCEAKLSVFDLGKPISQKCPKCGNTFDVMPEGAVETPAVETPSATPPAPEATAAEKPVSVPATPRPPAPAPVAVAAPEPVVVESGISFLHVLVIFALLFTIIVVQVITFKKTQSRLNDLSAQVQALPKK
ncbi:MAG: zinc-ribbon domain-containing protein [Kiritimatiellaeota bacterium]|nr:zinc-ribbon domain-containing protein [Kiritimatiellota bacterium]